MENSEEDNDTALLYYSVTIGDHLHYRIEKHIRLLKLLEDEGHTKQKWILNAVKEKLKKECDPLSSKDRHLQIKIDPDTHQQIEEQVNLIKKGRRSYSKKQLIVEAIFEQLDREEEKARELLEKLKNSIKTNKITQKQDVGRM